jgi:hypothetical protein
MRYGAHLKERTFVAKLSHDGIACFQRDAPLDAGRPASNCTESQIVVRNRTALPQKHRNDSRHDLDIGFLIDRESGRRDGLQENEHFKREPKEIHRSVFGLSMALMPTRLQNAPRFLDDGQFGSYPVMPAPLYRQVRWFMRFRSTGRGRSQALESKVRFADNPGVALCQSRDARLN